MCSSLCLSIETVCEMAFLSEICFTSILQVLHAVLPALHGAPYCAG